MRVCFITNQIAAWGKIGGFGTNTRRLGRALVERGVDVHVVVPRRPGQGRLEELDGMAVHGQSAREVFWGWSLYREIDADIYHAEEPTIAACRAQRALPERVHLVTSMDPRDREDWKVEFLNATWLRRAKLPLQHYYENGPAVRRAVRGADGVYVEAEFLKQKTRRVYGLAEDPGLLPKPIELPAGPFRKEERPLCAFLGRFDPRKRPELFFRLAETMPDVDFVAVGRAHDRAYQRHLERRYFGLPNLRVTGFVDPFASNGISRILEKAWLLVHPAAREGLPTAFQEASAHEVAIIAFVDPGGYVSRFGRVVPDGDGVEGLAVAVRQMVESGEWRERGRRGRDFNARHHSIDVSAEAHLHAYEQHLSTAGEAEAKRSDGRRAENEGPEAQTLGAREPHRQRIEPRRRA